MRLAISCCESVVGRGRLLMSALRCLLRCKSLGLSLGLLMSYNLYLLGRVDAWNLILTVLMLKRALLLLVGQVLLLIHLWSLLLLLLSLNLLLQNNLLLLLLWLWQYYGLLGFDRNHWWLGRGNLYLRWLHILDRILLSRSLRCLLLGFFLSGCIVRANRPARSWVRGRNSDCWLLSTSTPRMSFNRYRDLGSFLWCNIAQLQIACRH